VSDASERLSDAAIKTAIMAAVSARGPQSSICPSDAARALLGDGRWQTLMPSVRRAAIALAQQGAIEITRKGKPVDLNDFRGVYRLRIKA
jgi:hypothetical protein